MRTSAAGKARRTPRAVPVMLIPAFAVRAGGETAAGYGLVSPAVSLSAFSRSGLRMAVQIL